MGRHGWPGLCITRERDIDRNRPGDLHAHRVAAAPFGPGHAQAELRLVGDSEKADTFTAVGISQCVV